MSAGLNEESIVCTLDGAQQRDRRRRWEELCRRSLIQLSRTSDGVELRFDNEPVAAAELRSLVALEADCCSFARWVVREYGDQLRLRISAGADAEPALQALFLVAAAWSTSGARSRARL